MEEGKRLIVAFYARSFAVGFFIFLEAFL